MEKGSRAAVAPPVRASCHLPGVLPSSPSGRKRAGTMQQCREALQWVVQAAPAQVPVGLRESSGGDSLDTSGVCLPQNPGFAGL